MNEKLTSTQEIRTQIHKIMSGENDGNKNVKHKTVFHELLESQLRPEEKNVTLLYHEAASITAAGIDTTKTALTLASFWILKDRKVYERLHQELVDAIPDASNMPPLTELEKLPYLNAVVQECTFHLQLLYQSPTHKTQRSASPSASPSASRAPTRTGPCATATTPSPPACPSA